MVDLLTQRFDCILFDLGNTLVKQANPGMPYSDLQIELLPGVHDLLAALHGHVQMGIVSNTQIITADQIREKLAEVGIEHYFEVVIATGELGVHKPDRQPIDSAISALAVDPSRCLYVGDIETDLQAATKAGLAFAYTGPNIYQALEQYSLNSAGALDRALYSPLNFSQAHFDDISSEFDGLAKPVGSLGQIEKTVAQIAGISHSHRPSIDPAAVAVFAGDHGVASAEAVTPWPQQITGLMLDVMGQGRAAVSVIAESVDVYCQYINVGALNDSESVNVRNTRVIDGTQDFRLGSAMTREQVIAAMEIGAETAERLVAGGSRSLCTGELGIGNTTSSAILIAHYLRRSAIEVTGRGSGIDDKTLASKIQVVDQLIDKTELVDDPIDLLTQVGGSEIAALVGYILRGATLQVPIILDGVITVAAATVACDIRSEAREFLIAAHRSTEPAASLALSHLGLAPLLDLGLRLGEGTGAVLSVPIIRSGCQLLARMARISELLDPHSP